ncbi:MAG: hypothetical protein Q8M31_00150 [Beijerinckiaceae bacterium]|nr:hypothetical protein [Beijerinckiaceae bacterium]
MNARVSMANPAAVVLLGAATLFALLLAGPARTMTTVYVNDLFIFLDGAHRILAGQAPNRDFHTALGPLVFYLPAAGAWLSGSLGAAMPLATALLLAFFGPLSAYVLTSRLRPALALPLGILTLLIVATPVNTGESIGALSFAMFYNRVGWAAMMLLLVMSLPPTRGPRLWSDALCAAALVTLMLFMKATYGLVAFAFLGLLLLDRHARGWAIRALGLSVAAALAIEALWGGAAGYVEDLLLARGVSGSRTMADLTFAAVRHLADYMAFGLLVGLCLWVRWSWRNALFFAFCATSGLLILVQNSQPWGIMSLFAGSAVAIERLLRTLEDRGGVPPFALAAPVIFLALTLPTILHNSAALGLHFHLAATRAGEPFPMPGYRDVRLPRLWNMADHAGSTGYLATLREGAKALESVPEPAAASVLDFVNPFSAGLGLEPPRGDSAWLHWERNVNARHHISGDALLGGTRLLMLPKHGINPEPLAQLYADTIQNNFEPVLETNFWVIAQRKATAAPLSHARADEDITEP